MPTDVVHARRTSLAGPLLLPLVLGLVGVVILVRGSVVFGAAWVAIFGVFLVIGLVQVVIPPTIELTPTGIRGRTTLSSRTYAWDDCTDFHVWNAGRRSMVAFGYHGSEGGALSDRDGRSAQADRALPNLPGVPGDEVLDRINAYRDAGA
jgi:hypothetical protein